jgi:ATP-dependent Clp protease adaptor protein ClpS
MKEKDNLKIKPEIDELTGEEKGEKRFLVLHNDEVHTFDYVIDTLIEICELEIVQAEQCTYLVHYKGKCDVKKGTFNYLRPFKQGLIDRGLNATID